MVDNGVSTSGSEMTRRTFLGASGVAAAAAATGPGIFFTAPASAQSGATWWPSERIVTGGRAVGWEFTSGAGGWRPGNGLSAFTVSGGTLSTTVTGLDAWMVHNAAGPLTGLTDRVLRIRLKVVPPGSPPASPQLRVMYDTEESPGFSNVKSVVVPVVADGQFHEYVVDLGDEPLWKSGTGRRLRLDAELPVDTQLTFDHVVVDRHAYSDEHWFAEPLAGTGTAVGWEFGTDGDAEGWIVGNGLSPLAVSGGTMSTTVTAADPWLTRPNLNLDGMTDRILRMRVRLTASRKPPETRMRLYFATTISPSYDPAKTVWVPVVADGAFHEVAVDLGAENALWREGTITKIRLDREPPDADGGELEFDFIRIERMGPRLAVRPLAVSPGTLHPSDPMTLTTRVVNVGAVASPESSASVTLPASVALTSGTATVTVPPLEPFSQTHDLSWSAQANGARPGTATVEIATPDGTHRGSTIVPMAPDVTGAPLLDGWSSTGVHTAVGTQVAVLRNTVVQTALTRTSGGTFSQLLLAVRSGGSWKRVATSQPFGWILVAGPGGTPELRPLVPTQVDTTATSVILSGAVADSAGTTWAFEMDFALGSATSHAIRVTYRLTPDAAADLIAFRGPALTAGEGTFGGSKDAALFPGVEWLVSGERSSSTLDIHPRPTTGAGSDLRVSPHHLNVTIPLMAVAADGAVVSVQWDTTQAWAPGHRYPKPVFASPNWLDGQDNHLMALSLPAERGQLPPVSPYPPTPYPAAAGTTLTLAAEYTAAESTDVLSAVDRWHDVHGVPQPAAKPFTYDGENDLILHAYLDSFWHTGVQGWFGIHGRAAGHNTMPAVALLHAGYLSGDSTAARARVREFAAAAVDAWGPGALSNARAQHVGGWLQNGPFYLGRLEEALPEWQAIADDFRSTQRADGSWGFTPREGKDHDEMLGAPGTPIMGRSARNAHHLLRHARVVGDDPSLQAGLAGVAFVNQRTVPRAAQEWEVAIHTPDVLAAAYGMAANAEAYRATSDQAYLDAGLYWAKAGLPFLYHWADPDRPMLTYASMPVFGASRFRNSWFLRPVQWNGLVYALFLQDLFDAMHDPQGVKPYHLPWDQVELPYDRVAEGLIVSAMHQQTQDGESKGGFPDNWWLDLDLPAVDFDLNPARLANPFLMFWGDGAFGRPVDAQTALLSEGVRVSTAADVRSASLTATSLDVELGFHPGWTAQLLVGGLATATSVTVDGRSLPQVASLTEPGECWKRLPDGTVLVKLKHATTTTLTVGR